jgi:hypothetical protein
LKHHKKAVVRADFKFDEIIQTPHIWDANGVIKPAKPKAFPLKFLFGLLANMGLFV